MLTTIGGPLPRVRIKIDDNLYKNMNREVRHSFQILFRTLKILVPFKKSILGLFALGPLISVVSMVAPYITMNRPGFAGDSKV